MDLVCVGRSADLGGHGVHGVPTLPPDSDAVVMRGTDSGTLYFEAHDDDLAARDFRCVVALTQGARGARRGRRCPDKAHCRPNRPPWSLPRVRRP